MTGAEILIDALKKEGVDVMFGYPGGVVIPIFDVLNRTREIRFILTRHEQGATHAADGYARATGKVGVCLVTSGPGATNTVTGIANAQLDSIPIVVISGQVRSPVIGTDAFQEADVVGLTRSICKHNYLVQNIEELPRIIKEAFHIASTGRPGPVSLDIPADIINASLKNYMYPKTVDLVGYKPTLKGNARQIERLAHAIANAKRPLLYTGGGIISSNASPELVKFINKTNIPVVITLMGLGSVPADHQLFLGMPGMHGRVAANYALMQCDLLVAVGTRFDDRVTGNLQTFAKQAIVAHVDIDPAEISKNVKTDIPVVGDAKNVLAELIQKVAARKPDEWNKTVNEWKTKHPLAYKQEKDGPIVPQYVIDRISHLMKDDAILVTDVGQHQMWSALFLRHRQPRSFLSSGGLGTMGFGLPAAMGAAMAFPKRQVIDISGDGSIQMNIQELATCAVNRIPVKIVVLNNGYLGMVRQWQQLFWKENYASTCLRQGPQCPPQCKGPGKKCKGVYWPDFVKVAEANGLLGLRAEKPSDVDKVLKQGFKTKGPVLMEFVVKSMENVYPMVPAGKSINEIITGDA
ncbi:MAG: acetolactate synthase, large subunit, biosynthetic type [Candidatus Raymondbacteria bacterium RifOxyA12_full_50_37]|uniref:Acetolactate synthase n=1 Tax=Candidatus Raymondbacteria bacterium RIFOXYD12_FULL_49_13 TaxID=1817890 RepID=A0A1F7F5T3_UNCRA|nr:MAG: acetolactate synthase, large subunit, biosynthetic type [Candidatus Raymondbacteria bacterium RifOxyA12_full_50_37]OGJ92105.1 MAG: acetolactate synthase, large subunit, biosynthetic type [Candidatus Raymondbacteria bacterium RIFOXYA2_FULL_49_16]OGJ98461.1 MAG: acetolactate synthase, large subunit, biosynthetic type [Candidatus Raymondbacteria bacterium RIFOXYC2_FULL_50_21]OGK02015.1 MAG: acetolactate synthase, large subunit, biosynthetic type [Candidatus Raymondbacteria bacterium RIFOXYD